jgi:hypothetical protein
MQVNLPATDILGSTLDWFEKAVPEPTDKNFTTQLGVHVEEFGEMLDELTPTDKDSMVFLRNLNTCVKEVAKRLKEGTIHVTVMAVDRRQFLDSICDQIVTGTGVAHMSRLKILGAMNEVNRGNHSKFDENGNPIFDANLKVTKGPNYITPDLAPFV